MPDGSIPAADDCTSAKLLPGKTFLRSRPAIPKLLHIRYNSPLPEMNGL